MKHRSSLVVTVLSLVFGGALAGLTPAQQAALTTNTSGKPFFQSVALDSPQPRRMDFSVKSVGSVKGRVFSDEELAAAASSDDSFGISGVKVTLRSRDKGYENFAIEQYSDIGGSYTFQDLRPGNYTIEVDPNTLPTHFKALPQPVEVKVETLQSSTTEVVVTSPERVVMGTVFIDTDNDSQFKKGKDTPIAGAVISANGSIAVTDANGNYTLRGLPAGRIGMLVRSPRHDENTHVIFELSSRPELPRVVNVPMSR
jgi:hypothetical protein